MGAIGFSYGGEFSPDGQRIAFISNELAYFDPATGAMTPGPALPAEIAGEPVASVDGQQLAITVSGAATCCSPTRATAGARRRTG